MQQESPLSGSSSTPQGAQSDEPSSKITRRSHRKSREGCKNCKTRRIKCDEAKPRCSNCKRRQVRCSFGVDQPVETAISNDILPNTQGLQLSQIELAYHWSTNTSQSLSAWRSGAVTWQSLMEDVALSHPHVLHLMFALTALHLAHNREHRREQYTATANQHYEHALAGVTQALANINTDNCEAILLSVQLICFVAWARGPHPGEYLAFSDQGRSDWLVMFRGIRTTLESFGQHNFPKRHGTSLKVMNRPLPPMNEPTGYQAQLSELYDHVHAVSPPKDREEDIQSVKVLKECYSSRYDGTDSEYHVVFAWLYRMSDNFLERLQKREPIPLILYAHFIVLMHEMERFWYMKGWTHHVMKGIHEALVSEYKPWIKWPMAEVGWIAP